MATNRDITFNDTGNKNNNDYIKLRSILKKQHYAFSGKHSAVKLCNWTKKSIVDEGFCYKQQFYGIKSHRCCQMSPSVGYCTNKCIHCWREMEYSKLKMDNDFDEVKDIIWNSIKCQRKLLSGYFGNSKADRRKLEEALNPIHFAISLTGEPTLYPKLPELIYELNKMGKTTFLVTNGQLPEVLKSLKTQPTQLYISVSATNKNDFKRLNASCFSDGWERLISSLKLMRSINTRTAIRFTLIKGINMKNIEEFAYIADLARPMFIEAKAYMYVGSSRKRLRMDNMPLHSEVVDFARKIADKTGYRIYDENKNSRVVLLVRDNIKNVKIFNQK